MLGNLLRFLAVTMSLAFATIVSAEEYVTVTPVASNPAQIVRYSRGVPYVDIVGAAGAVRVMPRGIENGSLRFEVSMLNNSNGAVNFGLENIRAVYRGRPVAFVRYNELARRADRRRGFRNFMSNLGAALSSNTQNVDTYSGVVSTNYGTSAYVQGTVSRPLSPQERAAIEYNRQQRVAENDQRRDSSIDQMNRTMLQTSTVPHGSTHGGVVVLNQTRLDSEPQNMAIEVTLNNETYTFQFMIQKE